MACIIIALAIAAIPVSDSVVQWVRGARVFSAMLGNEAASVLIEADADAISDAANESAQIFNREVIDMHVMRDVHANQECSVVGFTRDGDAADVFAWLSETLALQGWVQAGSSASHVGSFVKKDGQLNWLFIECIAFGAETSVVVCVC